jgi:1-acyl-sn-glycerol-3-phosphate acyltransferase
MMLFGNHPNDLPDVLAGYFTTERQLRYVATIAGTTMPLAAAVYRVLGVIPVTRIRDVRKMREKGVDVAVVNQSAFEVVREAFLAGDAIGAFPEGGVQDSSEIGKMRYGVAKMALESLDDVRGNDITMVAFGLQYEAPQTMRSDVSVVVGHAVFVA